MYVNQCPNQATRMKQVGQKFPNMGTEVSNFSSSFFFFFLLVGKGEVVEHHLLPFCIFSQCEIALIS